MRSQRGLGFLLEPALVFLGAVALTALLLPMGARARREGREAAALSDLARIARSAAEAPAGTSEASRLRDPWGRSYSVSRSAAVGWVVSAGENGLFETPDGSLGPRGDDLAVPFLRPGAGGPPR